MKKMLLVLLIFMFVVSLSITAFADESSDDNIIINRIIPGETNPINASDSFTHTGWSPDYGLKIWVMDVVYDGEVTEYETYRKVGNHYVWATMATEYHYEIGMGDYYIVSIRIYEGTSLKNTLTTFGDGDISHIISPGTYIYIDKKATSSTNIAQGKTGKVKVTLGFSHPDFGIVASLDDLSTTY